MSAQRGKEMLLKIGDEGVPVQFTTIGGLRTKTLSFNAQAVDITHAESAGWRELLSAAGVRQASVSGNGVFLDDIAAALVRDVFFLDEIRIWQMIIPDFGIIEGPFLLTNLDYAGEHRAEVSMSLALESAGSLNFTGVSG